VSFVDTKSARALSALLLLLVLGACKQGDGYALISAADTDCFSITVSPGDDDDSAGDDDDSAGVDELAIELHPAPGVFDLAVIGDAVMSPSAGPAETRFFISIRLVDTGTVQGNPTTSVDRATITVDNGEIDLNELEMEPSPVDERLWTITLVAGGDPETTTRTDSLCVGLYTATE